MVRRSSSLVVFAGVALVTLLLLTIVLAPRLPLPVGGHILGWPLTTEVQRPQVLYASSLSINQGSVYEVGYDVNGLRLIQRSTQLIERLNISRVDVGVSDVVAPIIYDWYFDGVNDYIRGTVQLTVGGAGFTATVVAEIHPEFVADEAVYTTVAGFDELLFSLTVRKSGNAVAVWLPYSGSGALYVIPTGSPPPRMLAVGRLSIVNSMTGVAQVYAYRFDQAQWYSASRTVTSPSTQPMDTVYTLRPRITGNEEAPIRE